MASYNMKRRFKSGMRRGWRNRLRKGGVKPVHIRALRKAVRRHGFNSLRARTLRRRY